MRFYTTKQVRTMRRLLEFGKLKQREIADIFNTKPQTISRIKRGWSWAKC